MRPRLFVIYILIVIILGILAIEVLFRCLDPRGAYVYFYDVYQHNLVTEPHPTGYRLQTGVHNWRTYTATILDNGTRLVPASDESSDCTIATIGDSVTFGQSVNDAETFTSLLAQRYPAHWMNTGREGYSVDNIRRLQAAYAADGYIYLIIPNDSDGQSPVGIPIPDRPRSGLQVYLSLAWYDQYQPEVNTAYFLTVLTRMDLDRILLFGFQDDPLAQAANAVLLPMYTKTTSDFDNHPSAAGHLEIADNMMPYIADFIERVCDGL